VSYTLDKVKCVGLILQTSIAEKLLQLYSEANDTNYQSSNEEDDSDSQEE